MQIIDRKPPNKGNSADADPNVDSGEDNEGHSGI